MELIGESGDLRVSGVASTGEDALEHLARSLPNLMLVDVSLPRMSGLDLVATVRQRWPGTRVVVLSGHGDRSHVSRAISAGADGFVVKGNPEEIVEAIRRVFNGERYFSGSVRNWGEG